MKIDTIKNEVILPRLKAGEELIGYFSATKPDTFKDSLIKRLIYCAFATLILLLKISLWWMVLCLLLGSIVSGVFGVVAIRFYCLGVTSQGIHQAFKQNSFMSKTEFYTFYPYQDLTHLKLSTGYLYDSLELQLKDDKKACFNIARFPGMDANTKEYLLSKAQ